MKPIKLFLLVIVFVMGNYSTALGISSKTMEEKGLEYHNDMAILLFPLYLPIIAIKFTFYDFPKAGLSMPWELGKKILHPSYTEVESLIKSLNDPDVTEKQFIIYRLKFITGQSFGDPAPLTKDRENETFQQWNQWWKAQSHKLTK